MGKQLSVRVRVGLEFRARFRCQRTARGFRRSRGKARGRTTSVALFARADRTFRLRATRRERGRLRLRLSASFVGHHSMAGGAPPGKGAPEASPRSDEQHAAHLENDNQHEQQVSVVGNDVYSVGFIMMLLLLGMMKAAANRCTC
eukprot:31303-Pelagococcus_subviridis.AAC.19